ncbi:MAG TPA: DUF2939 domain-containing protein [Rhizomicrobium sp.]|jgi:hypothetical protein|nr:DUF2939 domain-containing protein [Rhizomicrobium sp.]
MSRRLMFGVAIAAMVVFVAAYVASPYWAYRELQGAARSGDQAALESVIDFSAVRSDLKAQLNAMLLAKMQSDPKLRDNPFAELGLLIAPALIDKMVESYLTPQAVSAMIVHARAPKPDAERTAGDADSAHIETHYGYVSPDRFRVTLTDRRSPDRQLSFMLARRGLFGWKLIAIALPPQLLD